MFNDMLIKNNFVLLLYSVNHLYEWNIFVHVILFFLSLFFFSF